MSQDDFDSVSINVSGIGGGYEPGYGPIPPNTSTTIHVDPNIFTNGIYTSPSWTIEDISLTSPPSGKLKLEGEDADIEINGRSLMEILDGIEQRLGLLKMREDLESEWEELRAFGEQYRAKLAEIENKTQMWKTLKR